MSRLPIPVVTLLPLLALVTGCEVVKSSNPLSPSVAGPIPGVSISAPKLIEPGAGWEIDTNRQPLTLLLENATTNGQRPLFYRFEVAADAQFTNKVYEREGVAQGENGRTSLRLPDPLESGRPYYWRARAEDGANTGPFAAPAHFNIFTPVIIDVPVPVAPIAGVRIAERRPTFIVVNAPRSGPAGQLMYTFEIASQESLTAGLVAIVTVPEQANQTSFTLAQELDYDKVYFWRVRAYDPNATGPWSAPQVFVTPLRPAPPPPPPPVPAPGGGGGACGPPYPTTPLGIVTCRRSQYGTPMSSGQLVEFLRNVARDLNAAGIAEGPFGILRKSGGHNCGGYSCDIVCSGQGNAQKQWDVLSDAENTAGPVWSGPFTLPNIRVDVCEIQ